MEKLIELIYKYNEEKEGKRLGLITSVKENDEEIWFDKEKEVMKYECEIISKSYGFIKWLVDNDKIDKIKLKAKIMRVFEFRFQDYATFENALLMLLAIQDEPLTFLISILK